MASGPSSRLNGFVRDEPRIVPPRGRMPRVDSTVSSSYAPSIGPRQPSLKPTISWPWSSIPLRTTARITAFRPGQSPPPVSTPIRTTGTIPALVRMARRETCRPSLILRRRRCALAAASAGGGGDEPARISGDVATVYTSVPRHGVSVSAAERGAGGRAARARRARTAAPAACGSGSRELPATDERDHPWDPALVAANAQRAADDPTAMAYLGELDYGATAVSLPITNNAGLLQVSPSDGLTSLLQRAARAARAPGPSATTRRTGRSFVRIGPSDLDEARALVDRLGELGATPLRRRVRPRDLRPRAGGAGHDARARRGHHAGRRRGVPRARGRHPRHRPQAGGGGARRGRPAVRGRTRDDPDARLDRRPAARRAGARVERDPGAAGARAAARAGAASRPSGRRSTRSAPATRRCALVLDAIERGRPRPPPRDRGRRSRSADLLQPTAWSSTGPARTGISARAQARFSSR